MGAEGAGSPDADVQASKQHSTRRPNATKVHRPQLMHAPYVRLCLPGQERYRQRMVGEDRANRYLPM